MLILECSQGCDGQTDGSVTISLCNFVGEGIMRTDIFFTRTTKSIFNFVNPEDVAKKN
jgi:hypothetical protein